MPRYTFQSTRPRGARLQVAVRVAHADVSIHAPAWGATRSHGRSDVAVDVSIHAPAWGATQHDAVRAVAAEVSIHAPAWGATSCGTASWRTWVFQSTRPRGARRFQLLLHGRGDVVSIHAPAWGATMASAVDDGWLEFQSTRPRGARQRCARHRAANRCFNPRARVGRDVELGHLLQVAVVSIHAPAWGATGADLMERIDWNGFNPRARVGRDGHGTGAAPAAIEFQSTRPRGARLFTPVTPRVPPLFQSTRPRGARRLRPIRHSQSRLFQSTRPRGARPEEVANAALKQQFQSTRPRGARPKSSAAGRRRPSFNPRARVGRDPPPAARTSEC